MPAAEQASNQAVAKPRRDRKGRILPGMSGNPSGLANDAGAVRRTLNLSTMRELQVAFNRGGKKAIDQVMRTQPALFLKMLVLLVPRELEVTHSAGVKAMSDEQIEQAIEAIQNMLAAREAKTIDVTPSQPSSQPTSPPAIEAPKRRRRKPEEDTSAPSR
jgi:hypothetical protein